MHPTCYVVLLKCEQFEIAECARWEAFEAARLLDAGICGVFREKAEAEEFVRDVRARMGKSHGISAFSGM